MLFNNDQPNEQEWRNDVRVDGSMEFTFLVQVFSTLLYIKDVEEEVEEHTGDTTLLLSKMFQDRTMNKSDALKF